MGDAILTTPLLREIRRCKPKAWITLVVATRNRELFVDCPDVNEVLGYDSAPDQAGVRKAPFVWRLWRRYFKLATFAMRSLWRREFSVAVNPRYDCDYYDTGPLLVASGAVTRIAFSEKATELKRKENSGWDVFATKIIPSCSVFKHEVLLNLSVLREFGGQPANKDLELHIEDSKLSIECLDLIKKWEPLRPVALAVGAGEPRRCWCDSGFIEVAKWLVANGLPVLLIGGSDAETTSEKIAHVLGEAAISVVGRLSLIETAALLKCCRLYVGNDTGPKHLAAAVGVPVVELSCCAKNDQESRYSPNRFRAWGVRSIVLQPEALLAPCRTTCEAPTGHCINQIQPKDVIEAIRDLLV